MRGSLFLLFFAFSCVVAGVAFALQSNGCKCGAGGSDGFVARTLRCGCASTVPPGGKGYVFVNGQVLSYAWLLEDDPTGIEYEGYRQSEYGGSLGSRAAFNRANLGRRVLSSLDVRDDVMYEHNLGAWGAEYDAVLNLGVRSGGKLSGLVFGADFGLEVPAVKGKAFYDRVVNRGSVVFLRTPYGEFSCGYQEGVESYMKVDTLGMLSGDTGGAWGRYVRGFGAFNFGFPFHMYPALYSENFLRVRANLDAVASESLRHSNFFGSLPFRISYRSPVAAGPVFGISYSPSGYKDDLFRYGQFPLVEAMVGAEAYIPRGAHVQIEGEVPFTLSKLPTGKDNYSVAGKVRTDVGLEVHGVMKQLPGLAAPKFDLAPIYRDIISGAFRYGWKVGSVKLAASVVGEYARAAGRHGGMRGLAALGLWRKQNVLPRVSADVVDFHDLAAIAVGVEAKLDDGLGVAATYGYLGRSGRPKQLLGRVSTLPCLSSERFCSDIAESLVYHRYVPSYYVSAVATYGHGPFSVSLGYFRSERGYVVLRPFDLVNMLEDVSAGVGYTVYNKNRVKLGAFVNCHVFALSQKSYAVFSENYQAAAVYSPPRSRKVSSGAVFLSGIKFQF